MRYLIAAILTLATSQAWAMTEQEKMTICFAEVERSVSSIKIIKKGWKSGFGEELKPREISDFITSASLLDEIKDTALDVRPSTPIGSISTEGLSLETQAKALKNIFTSIAKFETLETRIRNLAYAMQNSNDALDLADAKAKYVTDCIDAINQGRHSKSEPIAEQAASPKVPPESFNFLEHLSARISNCWSVNVGSRAANVTVVLGMQLEPDGMVVTSSMEMIEYAGGSETDANVAFQAARRAVLRCQKNGYYLPKEHYEDWKYVQIKFDPKQMRKR